MLCWTQFSPKSATVRLCMSLASKGVVFRYLNKVLSWTKLVNMIVNIIVNEAKYSIRSSIYQRFSKFSNGVIE